MIAWRGYGLIGMLLPLVAAGIASLIAGGMGSSTFTHAFRALLLAEVAVWLMGKRLNGDAVFDEAPHHFMGFRLQYAAVMYVELIAVYAVLG